MGSFLMQPRALDALAVLFIIAGGILAYRRSVEKIVERTFRGIFWATSVIISWWPAKVVAALVVYRIVGPYVQPWFVNQGLFRPADDFSVAGYQVDGADIEALRQAVADIGRNWLPRDLASLLVPLAQKYVVTEANAQNMLVAWKTYQGLLVGLLLGVGFVWVFAGLAFRDLPILLRWAAWRFVDSPVRHLGEKLAKVSSESGLDRWLKVASAIGGAVRVWWLIWAARVVLEAVVRPIVIDIGGRPGWLLSLADAMFELKVGSVGTQAVQRIVGF